jgi:hypothetical protein
MLTAVQEGEDGSCAESLKMILDEVDACGLMLTAVD